MENQSRRASATLGLFLLASATLLCGSPASAQQAANTTAAVGGIKRTKKLVTDNAALAKPLPAPELWAPPDVDEVVPPENKAGVITSNAAFTGTYAVDGNGLGRGVITITGDPNPMPFYLVSPSKGFIINAGSSGQAGIFEPQTGGPFSNASVSGNYVLGTPPSLFTSLSDVSGVVAANGAGSLNGTSDGSGGTGRSFTGTYCWERQGYPGDHSERRVAVQHDLLPCLAVESAGHPRRRWRGEYCSQLLCKIRRNDAYHSSLCRLSVGSLLARMADPSFARGR